MRDHLSPNFGERIGGGPIDHLILHYTGMKSGDAAVERLCDPVAEVSAHYLVFEDGETLRLVKEGLRAWHAGQSSWKGVTDLNSRSIGIEIVNPGHDWGYRSFPDIQIEAVISLCHNILQRHEVPASHILAHSDIAPARKMDPGEKFPWKKLFDEKIGHWAEPAPMQGGQFFSRGDSGPPVEVMQSMLSLYGYGCPISGVFDNETERVVEAFQRHFRQECVDGVADRSTLATLHRLISSLT